MKYTMKSSKLASLQQTKVTCSTTAKIGWNQLKLEEHQNVLVILSLCFYFLIITQYFV